MVLVAWVKIYMMLPCVSMNEIAGGQIISLTNLIDPSVIIAPYDVFTGGDFNPFLRDGFQ